MHLLTLTEMHKLFVLLSILLPPFVSMAQRMDTGVTDTAGIATIEKELRVKLVIVSDNELQFTFDKEEDRKVDIQIKHLQRALVEVEPTREKGTWKLDLSLMPNGTYLVSILDFEANKQAYIKVTKKGKHRKRIVAVGNNQ